MYDSNDRVYISRGVTSRQLTLSNTLIRFNSRCLCYFPFVRLAYSRSFVHQHTYIRTRPKMCAFSINRHTSIPLNKANQHILSRFILFWFYLTLRDQTKEEPKWVCGCACVNALRSSIILFFSLFFAFLCVVFFYDFPLITLLQLCQCDCTLNVLVFSIALVYPTCHCMRVYFTALFLSHSSLVTIVCDIRDIQIHKHTSTHITHSTLFHCLAVDMDETTVCWLSLSSVLFCIWSLMHTKNNSHINRFLLFVCSENYFVTKYFFCS